MGRGEVDYAKTKSVCVRLFEYRRQQPWPPVIVKGDGWDSTYTRQSRGLGVLPTIDEAVAWANDLIKAIDNS